VESVGVEMVHVHSMIRNGAVHEPMIEGMTGSARETRGRRHTGRVSAGEGTSSTDMRDSAAAHPTATEMATATTMATPLCPDRHRKKQRKRRNGDQATHTRPL